jgi:hypothetical protein
MKYNISCEVWGGITGHRSSLLKADGQIAEYDDVFLAGAVAVGLNTKMNGPNAKATFRYSVVEAVN